MSGGNIRVLKGVPVDHGRVTTRCKRWSEGEVWQEWAADGAISAVLIRGFVAKGAMRVEKVLHVDGSRDWGDNGPVCCGQKGDPRFNQHNETVLVCEHLLLVNMRGVRELVHMMNSPVTRYGSAVGLKDTMVARYRELHAAVWPDVLTVVKDSHICNYSIYLRKLPDKHHYLFSYFEYAGTDFANDMARMIDDPVTKRRWAGVFPVSSCLTVRQAKSGHP